ncbi:MAG: tetratricopeptide repeat protein [Bacteroidetes bacterium]|nr:tetratricopeptide repeat protein [Bacteroidota bacterium]HET6243420.1 tetratricopeptide repeat protein [Bacteroidia bacterium]
MLKKILVLVLFTIFSLNIYSETLDSLLIELKNTSQDTVRVNLLYKVSKNIYTQNPDSAKAYILEALAISEKENFTLGIANSYLMLGRICFVKSDYELGIENNLKALKYYKKISDNQGIVDSYLNIGNIYSQQEKYIQGVQINLLSLKYLEKLKDKEGLCYAHLSIGSILLKNKNFRSAKKFFVQAIDMACEIHDTLKLVQGYNNLGSIYLEEENFEKSLFFYNKALNINQKVNNKRSQAFNLGNIANVYNYQKKFSEALVYYLKSKQIFEEIGEKTFITFSHYNIGNLLFNQSRFDEAATYFYESIEKANEIGNRNIILMANKKLAELYASQKDYLSAYNCRLNFDSIKEKIIEEDNLQKLTDLEKKYESEKNEKEIFKLNLINIEHNLAEEKSRLTSLSLSVSVIILFAGGIVLYKRNKEKKGINLKLETAVKDRTIRLENQNLEKELMLKEIHHRVKNNLQLISSLLNLQLHYNPTMSAPQVVAQFNNKIKCMAMIHDKLYAATDFKSLNVKEYFSDLCYFIKSMSDSPLTEMEFNIESHDLPLDKMIPCGLILNELVSNSLKHGITVEPKGRVRVEFQKTGSIYCLRVVDNGIGFPGEIDFKNLDSLGLTLVHSLVEQLNGEIKFIKDKETTVLVCFSLDKQA